MSLNSGIKKMTLTTKASQNSYDIFVGSGIVSSVGEYAREVNNGGKAVIISDSNVAPLYAGTVSQSLENAGYETSVFVFEAGEKSKSLSTITEFYVHFARENITRSDLVIALGGGVTGDMAGFASATWLRGIDFVGVPTSLLAQVDSSVGGKTGVDVPEGKNLVGAFCQPKRVIVDVDTLNTLHPEFYADGMAEVIKTACIKDAELFEALEKDNVSLTDMVARCIDIKRGVVERDERESGERKLLNFGHSLAHAIERYFNYDFYHGNAVAIGMVAISQAAEKAGLTPVGTADRIKKLNDKFKLPSRLDSDRYDLKEIIGHIGMDKKRSGSSIDLVLLKKIGEAYTYKKDLEQLVVFLAD